MSSSAPLPTGVSKEAKMWSAFVAKNVKPKPSDNPDTWFLIGRTLLDTEGFNKINTLENDVVHGVQVIYGPFSNKQAMTEFVAEYEPEWPGDNEWRVIHPGQAEILSSYYEPQHAEVVHNASLDFQGQLVFNEQRRKMAEIEEINNRLTKRLEEPDKMSEKEVKQHILWQEERIRQAEEQLEGLKKHLTHLHTLLE